MEGISKIKSNDINIYAEYLHKIVPFFLTNKDVFVFKQLFSYTYRFIEFCGIPVLASEKAFNDFYERTGKDIRNYNWYDSVKDKSGNRFTIHKEYRWEHYYPASSFRDKLKELFEKNRWSVENILELIKTQKIAWITIEEDKKLDFLGFKSVRLEEAYETAGIKISNAEKISHYSKEPMGNNINRKNDDRHKWTPEEADEVVKAYFQNLSIPEQKRKAQTLNLPENSFCWAVKLVNQLDTGIGKMSVTTLLKDAYHRYKNI